jgi:hypothetical protein
MTQHDANAFSVLSSDILVTDYKVAYLPLADSAPVGDMLPVNLFLKIRDLVETVYFDLKETFEEPFPC